MKKHTAKPAPLSDYLKAFGLSEAEFTRVKKRVLRRMIGKKIGKSRA